MNQMNFTFLFLGRMLFPSPSFLSSLNNEIFHFKRAVAQGVAR